MKVDAGSNIAQMLMQNATGKTESKPVQETSGKTSGGMSCKKCMSTGARVALAVFTLGISEVARKAISSYKARQVANDQKAMAKLWINAGQKPEDTASSSRSAGPEGPSSNKNQKQSFSTFGRDNNTAPAGSNSQKLLFEESSAKPNDGFINPRDVR